MRWNEHFDELEQSYLFSTIAHKVQAYSEAHPQADLIRMGIGDVTQPICPAVIAALHEAVDEMADKRTFKGYGPEQGLSVSTRDDSSVLRELWRRTPRRMKSLSAMAPRAILGNALDLFDIDNRVWIPDPVYPVYVDTNVMAGAHLVYTGHAENGFLPLPDPSAQADLIYLCSPNNPTGAAYNRTQLKAWWITPTISTPSCCDAAHESFIQDEELPHSIYEIEGAKTCAIEFCLAEQDGGLYRLAVRLYHCPHALGKLNAMWLRRQTTKFNGVSYIIQRAAAAVFTEPGQQQVKEAIAYYRQNARVMAQALTTWGVWYTGGKNSPYLWMQCPGGMRSWAYFDVLLEQAHVVGTPGSGFGQNGEGFFRLTAFGDAQKTVEAMERMRALKL